MLGRIFKAYDVRGTVPDMLNEAMAWQIGYGVSKFLLQDAAEAGETAPMMRNIVVGRDMRLSSPGLAKALIQGIRDHGGDVVDVGMVDTSFIYFAVNHLDCAGGVQVTASHNPPNYNGFKVSKRKAKPVGETTGLAEVRKHAAMVDKATLVKAHGRHEERDLWADYAKHVRRFLTLGRPLKVVIDASNGMAGTMIPRVFGKLTPKDAGGPAKFEIIEVNFENSKGVFAHEPNPLVASNMKQTQEAVLKHKADVGFCYDGDADRCMAVDEKGHIVGCDHLTALLAKHFLAQEGGGKVAYDLRSTKAVEEEITKAGGHPVRGRVGHVFMKQALADHGCVFGGELSGHFYFRDNFNADSGAIAMAVLLSILSGQSKKLSELIRPIARYAQSGEVNFQIEDKDGAIAAIKKELGPGSRENAAIDELDGVTLDCFASRGWWANIRKSNTEPLLRLNAEAKDKATLDKVVAMLAPRLGHKVDH
ncbi:MAG: phosphomannomutase/phosphoglucomutase [Phycisphaeraceae bacterium]|nr:MAG: phosphomannomutase/phosphoglucomutase [Phycisphaeraceae bacterium]